MSRPLVYPTHKPCRKCGSVLLRAAFRPQPSKNRPNCIRPECRDCETAYRERRYIANKKRLNAERLEHQRKNPHFSKAWRDKNREHLTAYHRTWRSQKAAHRCGHWRYILPKWANEEKIAEIYKTARKMTEQEKTKYEVDHIVPLISDYVCGLHVETNLEIITMTKNRSKGNRYWPTWEGA